MKKPHKAVSSLQYKLKELKFKHAQCESELTRLQASTLSTIVNDARIKKVKVTKCAIKLAITALEAKLTPRIVAHGTRQAQRTGGSISAVA